MSSIAAPKYQLSRSEKTKNQFKLPSRKRNTSPATAQSLFQRSNLKAAPVAVRTYGSRTKRKKGTLSDSDPDEPNTSSSSVSTAPESVFEQPPEWDISVLSLRRSPRTKTSVPTTPLSPTISNHFISPEDIKTPKSGDRSFDKCFESPPKFDSRLLQNISPSIKTCKFCRQPLPSGFKEPPPTAARGRIAYCQRHENATILEKGRTKGYPCSTDFTALRKRLITMLPFIKKIINNPSKSEFMMRLRKGAKGRNAAQPMTMIDLFDECQPGYYGPRGSELISDVVLKELGDYIRENNNLYEDLKFCGGVTGYIQSVVVPEVGLRLIMEDMEISKDEARTRMKESVAYGGIINASVEDDEDEEGSHSEEELPSKFSF